MFRKKAETCSRLAAGHEKASAELGVLLKKWFEKHFVKGLTLPQAKGMHSIGVFSAFDEALQEYEDQTVIAVVRKLDPHCIEVLSRPRDEMLAHIRALASGAREAAGKPKPPKKAKAQSKSKPRKPGGILANAR
ncbi:MAG: hypothetical protein NW205_11600 [Hyphomicrobiaceae bacterium]|nr:hypothetical protein [Hyphomicrobiaceae bacterium]